MIPDALSDARSALNCATTSEVDVASATAVLRRIAGPDDLLPARVEEVPFSARAGCASPPSLMIVVAIAYSGVFVTFVRSFWIFHRYAVPLRSVNVSSPLWIGVTCPRRR